ncbi:uncharacterized protein LOC118506598 [Anopheles stephensi]|uniref:uncharacterized protein LOC118506598 n=1 Tax=Anopheles stephensi TaxID=30069 RepID=UPI001658B4F5|nr:uncharacterized protein LOC118506598 [Anopheles stephensi]
MRITGITYPTEDGTLRTILVQSSISLLDSAVREILPWFFNHAGPLCGVLAESSVAVRLQTKTDPFRYLRDSKCPPFDGKGFTLQRNVRHGGLVRIDDGLKISIEDFNRLCPGLFYGTAKYPSLNILLSLRRFRKYVVCSTKLWSIMYECLLCRQFNERQQTDGDFKLEMRHHFQAMQPQQDFRPEIAELQERIELSNQYSKLKNSLQQMLAQVHSEQVQRYQLDLKQLKLMLREAGIAKAQLLATSTIRDLDVTMHMDREVAAASVLIRKGELENLLAFCQAELHQAQESLEVRTGLDATAAELKANIVEIENIVKEVNSIAFMESEVENARCSIENNQSLMMLLKINNEYERKIYISNLQMHKQSMKMAIRTAVEDVKREKGRFSNTVDQMHKLKTMCTVATANDDSHCDAVIDQLQNTVLEIAETATVITSLEKEISNLQQQIWRSYLEEIPSIRFTELLIIAAVKMAVEMSDATVKEDFLGFVYDRALDTGIRAKWNDGLSCSAIFRSERSMAHVKQLIHRERLISENESFPYFVLETRFRTSLNNFLRRTVPEKGGGSGNYEEMVEKVNMVVERLVTRMRTDRKLNETRECLENLIAGKDVLLADLDGLRNGCCGQWPRINFQDLPDRVDRFIAAKNHQIRRQARYDSLEKLIAQIENNAVPLPNEQQLKEQETRFRETLETLLQTVAQHKRSYYNGLKQLATTCDTVQFALERFFLEDGCSMEEGLSSASYQKLIDCWTNCSDSIGRTVRTIEQMAQNLQPTESEPSAELDELMKQIQSLDLREKSLATRIGSTENMLENYRRENGCTPENNTLSHFTLPRQRSLQDASRMMEKIVITQQQLQQLPPGCSNVRMNHFKTKLKYLTLLDRERSEARDMCFNNLILPIIDKLHVQKLRRMCQLVSSVSEDLPDLGGTVKVSFAYATPGPEIGEPHGYSLPSFSLHRIKAINAQVFDDDNLEVSINETQRHLVYLILFLSFLYCDGCKLVMLDKACEQLFDNGIVSLFYVLEKHFPTMQFIFL